MAAVLMTAAAAAGTTLTTPPTWPVNLVAIVRDAGGAQGGVNYCNLLGASATS